LISQGTGPADTVVMDWLDRYGPRVQRTKQLLLDMRAQKSIDFATLTVALQELQQLTNGGHDAGAPRAVEKGKRTRTRP